MHIRLREVSLYLKIWEFEPPRRRLTTTHVTFHKTFKLFWKFPWQQTARKQQQRTLKRVFMKHSSRTEISHQKPFLRAHIFFIRRCHEQELIALLKRSRGIKFLIVLGSRHSRKHVIVLIGNRLPEWLASFIIIIFFSYLYICYPY